MENRSVLAYDIVPERERPVVVTIASETGWSLVGVMGSAQLDSAGAIALISARGLDAAIRPLAWKSAAAGKPSVLRWLGPTRTPQERDTAKLRAGSRPLVPGADAQRPNGDVKRRNRRATKPKTTKAVRGSKTKRGGRR
jgi:hypothetical protein